MCECRLHRMIKFKSVLSETSSCSGVIAKILSACSVAFSIYLLVHTKLILWTLCATINELLLFAIRKCTEVFIVIDRLIEYNFILFV